MKKLLIFLSVLIVLAIAAGIALYFYVKPEPALWSCENGSWVNYGNHDSEPPSAKCEKETNATDLPKPGEDNSAIDEGISVTSPKSNDMVSSPLKIEGKANGSWFFEAVFPVKLIDANRKVLAQGAAQTHDDWMTNDLVSFSAELSFATPETSTGTLILQNDNPSGLLENQKTLEIPVKFNVEEKMTVKVFFGNQQMDPQVLYCEKTYPTDRQITKTDAPARAAIEQLLAGPTADEKNKGFITLINPGVKILNLKIENETATIDFDKKIEEAVGGSCRVSSIRSQISETLKQFSTVKDVVIMVEGRTEDVLQP